MKINFNNEILYTKAITLLHFLVEKDLHQKTGIAVAVNHEVIQRIIWEKIMLKENDNILIITATQGG